jgi:hypothetical protein
MAKSVKTGKQKDSSKKKITDSSNSTDNLLSISNKGAFSGWPMIIGWAAMLIFTVHACTHMVAAGDTWVAMACGRHFVNHGVDTVEPFSANSHKAGPTEAEVQKWPKWAQWITDKVGMDTVKYWHPTGWVNQNWLTHVIFYKLVPKSTYADGVSFSSNALVYWKFAIYILAVICIYYSSRLMGVNRALAVIFSCFALFTGRSFLDIRPAGFSNLLVAVFIFILILTTYRNVWYIWLIVPLTVFWANVHGGYIYVFIMLVPFIVLHTLLNLPKKWTLTGYSVISWMALYGLAYKFLDHEFLTNIEITKDWVFYLLLTAVASSVAMTIRKKTSAGALNVLNVIATIILFSCLLARYFPAIPSYLSIQQKNELKSYITGSLLSFIAIFIFIIFIKFIIGTFKDKVILKLTPRGIYHTTGAYVTGFIAMVIFNPFHLTNLTHTFVISLSKHAERWRDIREWHPAFDWTNPVGTAVPFLYMYIIAWLALAVWFTVLIWKSRIVNENSKSKVKTPEEYQWPKIDISIVAIAAVTTYMAIRSRRFIPIAAFAACPIIAMFIDQAIRMVAAVMNLRKNRRFAVPPMPLNMQTYVILGGAMAVAFFGTFWGLKFKRVYLDPWPGDKKLNSVFMRMTASDAKPFYAMKFIKDNNLKGDMFNYWTEGGFIAFGQKPDPDTGRTPLQLFMDGRAQAAYNRTSFDTWTYIMSGGLPGSTGYEIVRDAQRRAILTKQSIDDVLTNDDYIKIGNSISKELEERNVWIAMMPTGQFDSIFMQGLQTHPDWRPVFISDRQKIFVDTRMPQGEKLFDGIFDDSTVYPDDYHKNLIKGHNWMLFQPNKKEGLEFAKEAFREKQSRTSMLEILTYGENFSELSGEVNKICLDYYNDFTKNEESFSRIDGYRRKYEAVRLACFQLMKVAAQQGNKELQELYSAKIKEYFNKIISISDSKSW